MKITNKCLIETTNAISLIGELKNSPKAIFALAKNLNRLKALVEDVEETRKKLYKENFGEIVFESEKDTKNHKNFGVFEKQYNEILNLEIEYTPFVFNIKDLNLEVNSVQPIVLSTISWLISDFNKE